MDETAMNELTLDFGLDPAIADALASMGSLFDAGIVTHSRALFEPDHDFSLPDDGIRIDDIPYGDDPRQMLDICVPGTTSRPILLFVPGGGFTGGDKSFYRHIPAFFSRAGFIAAACNYRLAPDHPWPAGSEDVAAALDWLQTNGAAYGGDPTQIVVVAQSAGAAHASAALFNPSLQPSSITAVRAAVLMSGVYHMTAGSKVMNSRLYYGDDPATYRERSATTHVAHACLPVYLTLAQHDPVYIVDSTLALIAALTARDGASPSVTWLKQHNHLSPVLGLGAKTDLLGPAIAATLMRHVDYVQ